MTLNTLLFAFTFYFGVIVLVSHTKLFSVKIPMLFMTFGFKRMFYQYLDTLIFLFSIIYQINFWYLIVITQIYG